MHISCQLPTDLRFSVGLIVLLGVQAGFLAYSATQNSATLNEPGHLVAGLMHWKHGDFDVYCVNPPLAHYLAAFPVMCAGYNEFAVDFDSNPEARSEFRIGQEFVTTNGVRALWLITIARWACIPLTLIGGYFAYLWSRDLWCSRLAGLITLFLWTFEPNILAHGQLITCDAAASSLGLGASYLFWRWLKKDNAGRAIAAGAMTGMALLTKTSWIILLGIWPALWLFWQLLEWRRNNHEGENDVLLHPLQPFLRLALILVIAIGVLNLGYGYDDSFTQLKDFRFVSRTLSGNEPPGTPGNRFQNSWIGEIPIPLPKQFVLGIDLQKKDFEGSSYDSYLRGEWKKGGWWYYYAYGLLVKTPHGSQAMMLLAVFTWCYALRMKGANGAASEVDSGPKNIADGRSIVILLTPPLALMVLVSSQLGFNQHVRYVLPVYGFLYVFAGVTSVWFESSEQARPIRCVDLLNRKA